MAKRFDASTPRPKSDGTGSYWVRVGSAFENDKSGLITIYLDAYPVPDKEGIVKIMLFEPRDPAAKPAARQQRPEGQTPSRAWPDNDEIPF